jgi:hypothetical protein
MELTIMVSKSKITIEPTTAPYTKREIDEKFDDIIDSLGRIEAQTTKTNGAVAAISKWREQTAGGAKVGAACLVLIIIPLAAWVLYNQATEEQRVQEAAKNAVSAYFSQYNIRVQQ